LGNNNNDQNQLIELEFFKNQEIIQIVTGYGHSMVLTSNILTLKNQKTNFIPLV